MKTLQIKPSRHGLPENGSGNVASDSLEQHARSRRAVFLKWLRKMHGWIGLWGAAIGLLFGVTGVLLNHRAVLKIPAAKAQETMLQIAVPSPPLVNAKAMAGWLQQELKIDRPATRQRVEPAKSVEWGDQAIEQPERWSVTFSSPQVSLQAEYWVGNRFVHIKRSDQNVFGVLTNLHKGNGVGIPWILLADTLAGSIILLSLTGVVLWTQLNRRRMIGFGIGLTSLALLFGFAMRELI